MSAERVPLTEAEQALVFGWWLDYDDGEANFQDLPAVIERIKADADTAGYARGRAEAEAEWAAAVARAADRHHANGCHYRHQQGETDECNSCTAFGFEQLATADHTKALDAVKAQAKAEALREAAEAVEDECRGQSGPCICGSSDWLRERANQIGGA